MFDAVQQLGSESLSHAPRDAEHGVALHPALHLAEAAEHALLGVLANRAGVDQYHIGRVGLIDGLIARFRQFAEHKLGIADVHLAAVRFDVNCGARTLEHSERYRGFGLGPTSHCGPTALLTAD